MWTTSSTPPQRSSSTPAPPGGSSPSTACRCGGLSPSPAGPRRWPARRALGIWGRGAGVHLYITVSTRVVASGVGVGGPDGQGERGGVSEQAADACRDDKGRAAASGTKVCVLHLCLAARRWRWCRAWRGAAPWPCPALRLMRPPSCGLFMAHENCSIE